jgi:BlaI family penicillinase repressor
MLQTFGARQLEILRVLWRNGPSPARDITDALNDNRTEPPVAHSTVQTLLRELEKRHAVSHEMVDRTFVFRATVAEQEVRQDETRDLLRRVFGGSVLNLATHLLCEEKLSPDELARLRALIDEHATNEHNGKEKKQNKDVSHDV